MRKVASHTIREDATLSALCFLDEERLACGLKEPPLVVVDLTGKRLATLEAKVHDVTCLSASADGQQLLSGHGSWGGPVVWDLKGGAPRLLDDSLMYVGAVRFGSDGRVLVAKGPMSWVFAADGKLEVEPDDDQLKATSVALSLDGTLRCELKKKQVTLSSFPKGPERVLGEIPGNHTNKGVIRFSADGTLVAVGDPVGNVRVWRVSDGTLVRSLDGKRDAIEGLDVSAKRLLVLDSVGGFDGRLRAITDDGTSELKVNGNVLAVSPSGKRAAVGDGAMVAVIELD